MRIGVLGPLDVTDEGRRVEVGGARLRALLTRLALDAGHPVSVEVLVDELWPDEPPGVNALQSLVSRLRRCLPDPAAVESVPGGYRLVVAPDDVDAHRFERLVREGAAALGRGEHAVAAAVLREALELWRGEPLADAPACLHADARAARLHELRLAAIEDRLDAELALGGHAAVTAELEALVAAHPLRERARALQMRALYAGGRQAEALAVYEDVRRRLSAELGVDPSPRLREVHLAVLRADPALVPVPPAAVPVPPAAVPGPAAGGGSGAPAGAGAGVVPAPDGLGAPATGGRDGLRAARPRAARTNLRVALTSFVGREADLDETVRLLGTQRLVTLVGAGGSGKTRLAGEAAARFAGQVAHGVWLAELAAITGPDDVVPAVLDAVGLPEIRLLDGTQPAGPRDALTRLVETLAAAEVLLVLDNCEHLVDAVARLADHLLGHCPRLRVLATSREPLGITGEAVRPVRPLGSPEPGTGPRRALEHPAVRLLADRARAVRGDFQVDEQTVDAVIEICRRLDGLPLAIELAAARLRTLPVGEVATRLDDRFRLLTGGSRIALPRHQTLRAVVDWSWDLLEPSERLAIERFAVFPGGVTADSAEAVCPPADLAGRDVVDVLSALVDKSLLHPVEWHPVERHPVDGGPGTGTRFRALETIREYGAERLAERGELAGVQAAHARYFLDLAETAEPALRSAGQLPWLARLDAERDNLLAALRCCGEAGDADAAVRMAAALGWFWTMRGSHAEAGTWLALALDVPGEAPMPARALTRALAVVNTVAAGQLGDVAERGVELAARIRAELDGVDVRSGSPLLAWIEPGLAMLGDDNARADEVSAGLLDHPDPWARAGLHVLRGHLFENEGDVARMRAELESALELFRSIGDRWGIAAALTPLAGLWLSEGRPDAALEGFAEARALHRELDSSDDSTLMAVMMAAALLVRGEREAGRRELDAALARAERDGSLIGQMMTLIALGELARIGGDLGEARRLLERAQELWQRHGEFGPPQMLSILHTGVALVALDEGDLGAAQRDVGLACTLAAAVNDGPVAGRAAVGAAALSWRQGEPDVAAELLGVAVRLRGMRDHANPDEERLHTELRRVLGEAGFDAAHDRGARLGRAEALARLGTGR